MNKQLAILAIIALIYFNVISGEDKETGELQLTEDQCRQLVNGKVDSIDVVQIRGHAYSALEIHIKPIINIPQILCRARYAAFMLKYRFIFQLWANRNCRPYIGCWCCPYTGLCITFIVRPIRLLCLRPIEIVVGPKIPIFEPQLQIDLQCS